MCGRYTLIPEAKTWIPAFGLPRGTARQLSSLSPNYNVAPTQDVPILRNSPGGAGRELAQARWGLIPAWAKAAKFGYHTINARAESVAEKPSFRAAYRSRRCLIPASGFYEWKRGAAGKQPYLIHMQNGSPMGFAGLWESWRDPQDGSAVHSCTIIVTAANEFMQALHQRMPVILAAEDYACWLDPDAAEGASLLKPCPSDWLACYAVSTYVNNPRHNDRRCIEPVVV
jgi:putative SOS response-associated peptidase YedK